MLKLIKSKKSQEIIVFIMISMMVLILIVMMAPVLKQEITKATNGTFSGNLSTSNENISIPNKATLIILDMGIFYYIGILVAISIAFVSGKKGFTGVITAIMTFVVVSVLITPLKEFIILIRDSGHLDCGNTAITVGSRLACIVVDVWLFYFVVTAISVAITLIFVKRVLPKIKGE